MPSDKRRLARRRVLACLGGLCTSLPPVVWAQPENQKVRPRSAPVWTGFGLNGGAGQSRYDLTREFVRRKGIFSLNDAKAFGFIREPMRRRLAEVPQLVQFKNSVEFGEDMLLGFAHDFEVAVGTRLEKDGLSANAVMVFMSGVGMILSFSQSTGWRVVSSFPFMLRMERPGGDLKNVRNKAVDYMGDAFESYGAAFVHFLQRFNKWDSGFSSNYFARLTRALIHRDAAGKLASYRIEKLLNEELLGFSTSASLCDNLDIPLLPFQENDALAKRYAVKFSDDLTAQKQIAIPDADLKFEVVLRHMDKQRVDSSQRGVTIVRRMVVLRLLVIDEFGGGRDKPLLNVLAASTGEDRIPLGSTEDDTPDRDLVFFDRLITRTLGNLLQGLVKGDEQLLAAAEVKLSEVAPALPRLAELCGKTKA